MITWLPLQSVLHVLEGAIKGFARIDKKVFFFTDLSMSSIFKQDPMFFWQKMNQTKGQQLFLFILFGCKNCGGAAKSTKKGLRAECQHFYLLDDFIYNTSHVMSFSCGLLHTVLFKSLVRTHNLSACIELCSACVILVSHVSRKAFKYCRESSLLFELIV